jgi:group I intron endonuclease
MIIFNLNVNLALTNLKLKINSIFSDSPFNIYKLKNDRAKLLKDNKNKSGIYCLFNIHNSNFYIGSSKNINGRMKIYLNKSFLIYKKNANQPIIKALIKYGIKSFLVIIIEFTNINLNLERETFWIVKLKPYYNFLQFAGSSKNYKHSESVKLLLSNLAKNRKHSEETKLLINNDLKEILILFLVKSIMKNL